MGLRPAEWEARKAAIRAAIDAELRKRKEPVLGKGAGDYNADIECSRPSYRTYGKGESFKPYLVLRAIWRMAPARVFRERKGALDIPRFVDALLERRTVYEARDRVEANLDAAVEVCERVLPSLRKCAETLVLDDKQYVHLTHHNGQLRLTIECPADQSEWLREILLTFEHS